jgi:segregation and condensation protein B
VAERSGPAVTEPNGFRLAGRPALVMTESAGSEAGEPGAPTAGDPGVAGQADAAADRAPDGEGGEAEPAIASDEPRLGAASYRESGEAGGAVAPGGPELGAADVWPSDEVLDAVELDDSGWTRRSLEAILLVADEPVPAATLAELVGARLTEVEALLVDLAGEYAGQGRGFVLRVVAGGWRFYTHPAARDVVEAYLRAGQQSRLTRAALETLAVIAYRQPVTRHQVAAVRGVNVDGVFRTLATRGLIQEVGHEEGPGQAALYATTPAFLEQLGLNSLDQLPPIKDYLPEGVDLMELLEQI